MHTHSIVLAFSRGRPFSETLTPVFCYEIEAV